jgi:hypothetical protein
MHVGGLTVPKSTNKQFEPGAGINKAGGKSTPKSVAKKPK